jgi:protein O-mannosyl-transferase
MILSRSRVTDLQLRPRTADRFVPYLASVVAVLLYFSTFRFEFVYDDVTQIVNNPLIRSWHNLPWMFTTDVWRFLNPHVVGNYWRPLFMVWLLINYKIFALNPIGWHLTAVLVHAAVTYLAYKLVRRLGANAIVAGIAALIFAIHPVHLETVAWVSGATDSLMSLFLILSLLAFVQGWDGVDRRWLWYGLSGLGYACALLSKETAIVLPGIALGFALIYRKRDDKNSALVKKLIAPMLMFAAIAALYWIGRMHALAGVMHSRIQISFVELLMTWPTLLWFYLKHLVWPTGLGIFYDIYPVTHPTMTRFWLPLAGVLVILIVMVAAWLRTRDRLLLIAALLFVLPILPAFVFPALVPTDFAHDRYLYFPCLGFAIVIGLLIQRFRKSAAQWVIVAVIVVALSVASLSQMVYWANNLLLFDRATKTAPGNMVGFDSLGEALAVRGRMNDATYVFDQVIKRDPNNWIALYNLGLSNFLEGNNQKTEGYLTRATQLYSLDGDSLAILAEAQLRQRKFSQSEDSIERAIHTKPYKPGYRRVLALALEGQGKAEEARAAAEEELKLSPNDKETVAVLDRLSHPRK